MTPLEQVNVQRLTALLKRDLDRLVSSHLVDTPLLAIKYAVSSYLWTISEKHAMQYKVGDMETRYVSWPELYPKLKDRILAYLAHKVFGVHTHAFSQRWYHTVFPFVIRYEPTLLDDEEDDGPDGYVRRDLIVPQYEAYLRVAHTATEIPVSIQPTVPAEFIKINCVVTREGMSHDHP